MSVSPKHFSEVATSLKRLQEAQVNNYGSGDNDSETNKLFAFFLALLIL